LDSLIIRLTWIGNTEGDSEVNSEIISDHMEALSRVAGVGRTAVYRLVPLDPLHQQLKGNLRVIPAEGSRPVPRLLVLSELQSMRLAVDAEDTIRTLPLEQSDKATTVVGRQVVSEISREEGVHASEYKDFAPAIQLGLYSMDSPESERYLAWWYHHRRFVPFKSFEGGIRARWFAVVWGATKYCVMYELVTRQAHSDFIAKVESLAHDKSHVTGDLIPHTIHDALLSQSVGVKIPQAQPTSR
jgi:hypothetical protein